MVHSYDIPKDQRTPVVLSDDESGSERIMRKYLPWGSDVRMGLLRCIFNCLQGGYGALYGCKVY